MNFISIKNKKELLTYIYSVSKSQKYCVKWKKPYTKKHILRFHLHEVLEQGKTSLWQKKNQNHGCLRVAAENDWDGKGLRKISRVLTMFYIARSLGYSYTFAKRLQMVHLRSVHVTKCIFYLQRKRRAINKYWTLVNDMHAVTLGGKIQWCLQPTLNAAKIKNNILMNG